MALIRNSYLPRRSMPVIFILEYKTLVSLTFLLQLPVRLFVRPTQMQAGIIAGSFGVFLQLTGGTL